MRIAFVGPMLGGRGSLVPNPAESLAPLLIDAGVECSLVSSQPGGPMRAADTTLTLLRWSRRLSMAVIVTYSGTAFRQAQLAARTLALTRVPFSLYLKGGDLPHYSELHHSRVVELFKRSQAVIAPSEYLADLPRQLGCPTGVIPNIFPLEKVPFRQRTAAAPRILWLRAFHDVYDPCLAIRTLAALRDLGVDATMTMAGGDKGELASTRRLVAQLDMLEHVDFAGFADAARKLELFANHDLFLHTSRTDNTPVSVYEAMAHGLPVVGTRVGGMTAFVGSCARLVPHGDPGAAAHALKALIDSPAEVESASRRGRARVEQDSAKRIVPLWLDHFQRYGRPHE